MFQYSLSAIIALVITSSIATISAQALAAFTISNPTSGSFVSKSVNTTSQTTTLTMSSVTVNDDRPGSPGWTASIYASHVTKIGDARTLAGTNNTVTSSGSYDGSFGFTSPPQQYVLTITVGGAVGTAKFDVSGAETASNIFTGALVEIGTKGVRADFDIANYVVNDQWQIIVDSFPYTSITVTPGTITANSGTLDGVSAGSSGQLNGIGTTSSYKTIMSASSGNGTGNYSQNVEIELSLHENSLSGNFSGVATFTVI